VGAVALQNKADDGIETDFDEMTITVIDPATVPSYSVTYNANGADSGTAPAPQVKTHGVDLTLESNSGGLTKAFYSFGGWNTAASGDGAAYPAGGTYSGNADVTLYAKWNLAVSTIPFVEDFEALAAGDLDGQNRWTASSTTVQSNRVYEGTQAATISGEGMMQQDILPVQTNVWTDFRTQPEFLDGAPTELPADATAVLYFNTSGHPVVYNGATPTTVDAITVATGQWVRVRIHSDYVAKTWDLHIDDTLAAEDLNFYTTTLSAYSSFLVKGGGMTGTALDALAITLFEAPDTETTTTNGTPYTWLDSFGITNDYELADLGDPDGDGALTWEEYLAGTDPTNAMSVFRLTSATIGVGGELELVWYGTTNSGVTTEFVVYRCTNLLSGGWEPVSTNTRSATGTNTWSGSGASGAAFYRIGM